MKKNIPYLKTALLVFVVTLFAFIGRADAQNNIVVNGNFSTGELSPWTTYLHTDEGVQANFTVANNKVTVEDIVTSGAQSWFVQLNQILSEEQVEALTIGKAYKLTFDVEVAEERPLTVYFGENGGGFTALALQNLTIPEGESSYEITVNVTQTWENMKLGIELGRSAVTTAITNVSLVETGDIEEPDTDRPGMIVGNNLLANADFATGELAPWTTFLAEWEGVQANFTVANNKVTVEDIVTNGAQSWFVQLNQEFSEAQLFQLTEGNMYRIGFTVEVAEARPLNVFLGQNEEPFTALALQTFQLEPGVADLEIIFEFTEKFEQMKLGFEMGTSNVTTTLSNLSLHEYVYVELADNIILDGDFESGTLDFWTTYVADFAGASANFEVEDGKVNITDIAVSGSDSWHIQLYQALSAAQVGMLEFGREYELEFKANAAAERPLVVYFGEDGGDFVSLVLETVTLPAGASSHKMTLEATDIFENMKLGFEMGLSNVSVSLSDISLREAPGAPPGRDPAPVMEENFILFAAGGRHITIPGLQQGVVLTEPQVSEDPVLQFNNGNWTIGGFDWGNLGVNLAHRQAAQDSIFMRIWSSPENQTSAREINQNNTAKIILLDIGETGNLEFRAQMALPDDVHTGQWVDVAFPLPAYTTKTELEEAIANQTITGDAALWEYWGAYSPVRDEVIDDVEDEDWREFNWERVRRVGIYWDQFQPPNAPIYVEYMYIGRSGVDLSVATQGPTAMATVSGTNLGDVNVLSWSPREDIFSYGVYYSGKPITDLSDPSVRLWQVIPGDVTEIEHPVFQPHPSLSGVTYHYAIAPGNAWGVLSQDVSGSSVSIQAKGEPKGFIFQLTEQEEAGVFNALDRGEFPGVASFPKDEFEPIRLRYDGEVDDFWKGPEDSQADVWIAYGTAEGFRTLFFYGEVLDDDVFGGPVGNEAGMSGTTIYPRCCVGDFEAVTWVPGITDEQLEWNFYLKDQLVVQFGAYLVDDYVTGSTNRFRSRGATPEYKLSFQPYFSSTSGSVDLTSNPGDMLVRLWITEPSGQNYPDYNSLYYNSQHPLTTPAVYENMFDENGNRIGWRFFAAVDSQDLLVVTNGGVPVDNELTLPAADQLAYLPMTLQLWDKDGGPAPGNWWETATSIIQFPVKPWGMSTAPNASDIRGMGAVAIAGRDVVTVSIDDNRANLPAKLELFQNYPNPFNPVTTLEFQLPEATFVTLTVYNALGQRVAVMANNELMSAGRHSLRFNGQNLSSGVYFYRLDTGKQMLQRKMILIK
ncbi:MAG: T9SS type A sorting domain-containing protein [Bacteroidetes bacterium]|nr:T9SS type A sorting domain-containing protein [Bacteroidota bacterium]